MGGFSEGTLLVFCSVKGEEGEIFQTYKNLLGIPIIKVELIFIIVFLAWTTLKGKQQFELGSSCLVCRKPEDKRMVGKFSLCCHLVVLQIFAGQTLQSKFEVRRNVIPKLSAPGFQTEFTGAQWNILHCVKKWNCLWVYCGTPRHQSTRCGITGVL